MFCSVSEARIVHMGVSLNGGDYGSLKLSPMVQKNAAKYIAMTIYTFLPLK